MKNKNILSIDTNLVVTPGLNPAIWFKRADEICNRDVVKTIFALGGSDANYKNTKTHIDKNEMEISGFAHTYMFYGRYDAVIAYQSVNHDDQKGLMFVNGNECWVFGCFLKTSNDDDTVVWAKTKGAFVTFMEKIGDHLVMKKVKKFDDLDSAFVRKWGRVLPDYKGVKPVKPTFQPKPFNKVVRQKVKLNATAQETQQALQALNKEFYIKKGELSGVTDYEEAVKRYEELVEMEKELLAIRDHYALVNPTYAKTRKPAQPLPPFEDFFEVAPKPVVKKPRPTLRLVA
ncbi:hypothetical protein D7E12_004615 [Salmonella enterica]|nr:hypothetical protein [Salmonella enterica]